MHSLGNLVYVVEGDTEKKFLQTLKTDLQLILPGKIIKFNVVQERVKKSMFLPFDKSFFVLIFDTDTNNINILRENIITISHLPNSKKVLCIPQVKNLEDELRYSCKLNDIRTLTGSISQSDFKRDFLHVSNLAQRLISNNFDIKRLWCRQPAGIFSSINNNGAEKIKRT